MNWTKRIVAAGLLMIPACHGVDGLGACAKSGGYIDPHKGRIFMCRDLTIVNGYTEKQVIALMSEREANAWKQLTDMSDRMEILGYAKAAALRSKNEYDASPRVHDIGDVVISKTDDSGNWVIMLQSRDGKNRASLWLDSGDAHGGHVRSITPY